ncbi:PEGA domain-containing protein [Candidatus Roizmanbacteria bacterium]|nr:PEGA domain-containing protein [Candidatus Roizmanbacteria bacterium]
MKSKLVLLLVLIILFIGFVVVRFFILDKQNAYGKLKIISSPTASVFINNMIIGKTPYDDKYKVGEYLLKLIPEGNATETASWNGKINVYKNSLTYVNRELGSSDIFSAGEIFTTQKMETAPKNGNYGEIYVESEPQGAIITLDNDEKGVAPLVLQDVLRGDHELSVFMPGFFRRTQKINVDPGYRVNASFKLALDQSQKQLSDVEKTATPSAKPGRTMVTINSNPQGWLRVRVDASINASEEAKVKVGEKYEFLDEKAGWYQIKYNGNKDGLESGEFDEGWVSSEYSTKE